MTYSVHKLPQERWGIYAQGRLLATYGCQHTCLVVLELLKTRKTSFATYKYSALEAKQAA